MKQATITLSLSKDHDVTLKNVTPIEALFLVSEHHKNNGGNPVKVEESTVRETGSFVEEGGKQVLKPDNRTSDQEIDRLKGKYSSVKLKALLNEVRDLPKDFPEAIERGTKVLLPTGALSSTKLT